MRQFLQMNHVNIIMSQLFSLHGYVLNEAGPIKMATWHDANGTLGITNVFDLACNLAVDHS